MNSSEGLKGLWVLDSLITDDSVLEDRDSSDEDSLDVAVVLPVMAVAASSSVTIAACVTGRGVGVSQVHVSPQKPHMSGM